MTLVPGRYLSSAEMHLLGNNVRGAFLRDRKANHDHDRRRADEEQCDELDAFNGCADDDADGALVAMA